MSGVEAKRRRIRLTRLADAFGKKTSSESFPETADGSARTRAVTTGSVVDDARVEILSGLDAGESVVVNAPGPVADGTPLEIAR